MEKWLDIDPKTYVLGAFLVLTIPLDWLTGAVLAAAFHEVCHVAAIRALGGRVCCLHIGLGGAVMDSEIRGDLQEGLCAAAGPVGSFLLVLLCHIFPKLAVCGAVQGLFNLLPIYPLDGGRILRCILRHLVPRHGERVMMGVEIITGLLLLGAAVYGTIRLSLGNFPVFLAVILIIKGFLRKRPCKQGQIKVQ